MTSGAASNLSRHERNLADKAGQSYWDRVWQGEVLPEAIDLQAKTRHNHIERKFHELFAQVLRREVRAGQELLEIGAARSVWLPYFATEFGFRVTGIDYSDIGCEQARAILDREGVVGHIVFADFNEPPSEMLDAFDVVVSFGVIEHFEDTTSCVESLARFLKPGGMMLTIIPNLTGSVGWIEKRVCRSIFDLHVPLARHALAASHEEAGLTVLACRYFMGGFSSLNFSCRSDSRLFPVICRLPRALSMPFWFLESVGAGVRPNRLTSPYVVCVATRSGRPD